MKIRKPADITVREIDRSVEWHGRVFGSESVEVFEVERLVDAERCNIFSSMT